MGNPLAITTTAANGPEREEVEKLTTTVEKLRPLGERMTVLEADKGYDADWLRQALLIAQIFPLIPENSRQKRAGDGGSLFNVWAV
jgi:IS5 family transposase